MDIGLTGYRWFIIAEKNKAPQELIKKFGLVLGQLIYNRKKIFGAKLDEEYIYPTFKNLLDPTLFTDLDKISYEIADAIRKKKRIVVYGDYDADGITSTSLLINFLREINVDVRYYIPSRFTEGYGLNKNAIKKISQTADLLIVVDSGTNAFEELAFARKLGLKVIVLDHHEPKNPEWKHEGVYILNPKLHKNINEVFKHLATVGIVFYLIIMLRKILNLDIKLKHYLDIVSIGTVADVVPLSLINRILVKKGIEELNKKRRTGLKALLDSLDIKEASTFDLSFIIAPRLNAAGRLDDAKKAVKLLTTNNNHVGVSISRELEALNKKRQKLTESIYKEAQLQLKNFDISQSIVVSNKNWHPGVVGIVAGRLAQKYKVPSVVLSIDKDKAIGSARSTGNINIYKFIEKNSELFEKFGGHALAAGFTIKENNIPEFRRRLNNYIKNLNDEDKIVVIEIDMEVPLGYWNMKTIEELKLLEPFGEGNPYPKFVARNLRIQDFMMVGHENQHLKFWFKDKKGKVFPALWWGAINYFKELAVGMFVDVVYTPKISSWKGRVSVEYIVEDIKINKKRMDN
jgi:single-stranded-DNA-specific exonuclease